MNSTQASRLSDAILYEGYVLYPYRPSAVKNRQRWNFGALCPRAYSDATAGTEAWQSHTECLVEGESSAVISITVRFLHLTARHIDGNSWQEGISREIGLSPTVVESLFAAGPQAHAFGCPASNGSDTTDQDAGARQQYAIQGSVQIAGVREGTSLRRLSITVSNMTKLADVTRLTRDEVMMHSLVSSHLVLHVESGSFVSLLEPPEHFDVAAKHCRNVGSFPVLIGNKGDRQTMLASPVILYDYPEIAPESEGDLFDGTEIDEILILRIMALTDQEKAEMRACDERARAILDRIEANPECLNQLHGTLRKSGGL